MRRGAMTTLIAVLALAGFAFAPAGEANPAPATHVVEVRQLRFQPETLAVAPGDTVVWINRDIVPHTVTALDAEWGSDRLEKGATWRHVVKSNGTVRYYCTYHPTMRGIVVFK